MRGIDYGLGQTNIDKATGIRYGVIAMNGVTEAWAECSESEYGEPTCPKCSEAIGSSDDAPDCPETDEDWYTGKDYVCFTCKACYWSDVVYGDEPLGYSFSDSEYDAHCGTDGFGIFITRSPYYTLAAFCSPCAPGAGDLNTPDDAGVRTYCFDHGWFDDGKAPYRVFRVSDDSEVLPKENR